MRLTLTLPDPRAWLDAARAKLARPSPPAASAPAVGPSRSPRLTRSHARLGAVRTLAPSAPAMDSATSALLDRATEVTTRAAAEITHLRQQLHEARLELVGHVEDKTQLAGALETALGQLEPLLTAPAVPAADRGEPLTVGLHPGAILAGDVPGATG